MRPTLLLSLAWTIAMPERMLAQGSAGTPDTTTRIVDRVFEAWRDTERPGCALGVSRNGRVVYEHGYGMANLETATPIRPSSIVFAEGEHRGFEQRQLTGGRPVPFEWQSPALVTKPTYVPYQT